MTGVQVGGDPKGPSKLAPDLISIPQAAQRLGLHPDTLYRLARTGQFPPAVHVGAKWLVSVRRLERFLHGADEATIDLLEERVTAPSGGERSPRPG